MPIFLLTSESGPDLHARARAVRATGWIAKPLIPARMLALIAATV